MRSKKSKQRSKGALSSVFEGELITPKLQEIVSLRFPRKGIYLDVS